MGGKLSWIPRLLKTGTSVGCRSYRIGVIAACPNGTTFINISRNKRVNSLIKKATGLINLDALYLSKKDINNFFDFPFSLP